ncbi:16S rRNA (cytidine(1402)-2'-O)-methyltransferase [Lucifera butyrica]|uniref:16S rRNA (cytidine(1402)-2'-O)-methyltransferase n=1 Tax=Lucifera butyrica TaxID=1351585 RepID=UPI002437406E|nr:16S rRNA (cytidine(1402)-2'-O)-methyltransferase [Lucifera butyrica]
MEKRAGVLYLCATPIGNLEDMTYRAVRILGEVSAIAAEDTRQTRKLLSHFSLHTPLISYHEHNQFSRGPELIKRLLDGEDLAVVSDAGLPGISDPGTHLVQLAIEAGVTVTPVPGANAALTGLVASGLDTSLFTFAGFLPKNNKKRRELLALLASYRSTLVLYESPHHLRETLTELVTAWGDRPAVAARELTKRFEEWVRGTLSTLQAHFDEYLPRGEFTLIIAGRADGMDGEQPSDAPETSVYDAVMAKVTAGMSKKDAIREVAAARGLPRREVYQTVVAGEDEK